jgi:hypothetical protein
MIENMKEMLRTLNEARREDPKEFWGGIVAMIAIFGSLYVGLWVIAILEGR